MNAGIRDERILVTVKTYPTVSKKYGENVCTAGLRPNGTWVRLYPMPLKQLPRENQFEIFDYIECRTRPSRRDKRCESYSVCDLSELRRIGHVGTDDQWRERRKLVLGNGSVHTSFEEILFDSGQQPISLATFKPHKVVGFGRKKRSNFEKPDKMRAFEARVRQLDLFNSYAWLNESGWTPQLPYRFYYEFMDCNDEKMRLSVYDIRLGEYYMECLKQSNNDDKIAFRKVRKRYFDEMCQSDVYFFLGTKHRERFPKEHKGKRNPWMIIGVFPVPHAC